MWGGRKQERGIRLGLWRDCPQAPPLGEGLHPELGLSPQRPAHRWRGKQAWRKGGKQSRATGSPVLVPVRGGAHQGFASCSGLLGAWGPQTVSLNGPHPKFISCYGERSGLKAPEAHGQQPERWGAGLRRLVGGPGCEGWGETGQMFLEWDTGVIGVDWNLKGEHSPRALSSGWKMLRFSWGLGAPGGLLSVLPS